MEVVVTGLSVIAVVGLMMTAGEGWRFDGECGPCDSD